MTVKSKLAKAVGGGSSKAIDISNKVIGILKNNPTLEPIVKKGKLSRVENIKLGSIANKNNIEKAVLKSEAKKLLKKFGGTLPVPTKKPFKSKKPNPQSIKNKGSKKGLTPAERKERDSLVRQVEEEMAREQSHGAGTDKSRRRKTGPEGTPEKQKVQQGPLLSKVPPPEKVSKARRRQLVQTGQATMGKGKGGKSVVKPTGEFAPPASMIAEEMGLRGKGKLPTAEEAEELGLTIKKYGGKVKRNMGGPAKPKKKTVFRRGGGQALRGFGKATYSNKLY